MYSTIIYSIHNFSMFKLRTYRASLLFLSPRPEVFFTAITLSCNICGGPRLVRYPLNSRVSQAPPAALAYRNKRRGRRRPSSPRPPPSDTDVYKITYWTKTTVYWVARSGCDKWTCIHLMESSKYLN